MTFAAGQKLSASELNDLLFLFGVATVDTTKTSSTALGDATGLSVALEASSTYIIDGYLAYTAGATGDLKVALSAPSGATGSWGLYGLVTSSTASVGDISAVRVDAFGDANTATAGGSDSFSGALLCVPRGYITTTDAGTLQLRFAQNTSSGTSTVIEAGSWLRLLKVT